MKQINDDEQRGNSYLGGFAMGTLIGAAAVFFFGTKKGKRVAKSLCRQGGKTLQELEGFTQDAKTAVKKLENQADSTKKAVTKTVNKKLAQVKKLQAKGRAATNRYFDKKN